MAFTRDGGKTLVSGASPLRPHTYTGEFAVLSGLPAMLVVEGDKFMVSRDAGCTWTPFPLEGKIPFAESDLQIRGLNLLASGATTAIAASDQLHVFVLLDSTHVKGVTKIPAKAASAWVGPEGTHLKLIAENDGELWDSSDSGATWKKSGRPPLPAGTAVFNAGEFGSGARQVILWFMFGGLWESIDQGVTWKPLKSSLPSFENAVHRILISPVDDRVVWLLSGNKIFYKSNDGGQHFAKVVENAAPVTAAAADPRDASALHFADNEGYLSLYDGNTGKLLRQKIKLPGTPLSYVSAFAFSDADSSVMYLRFSALGPFFEGPGRPAPRPASKTGSPGP